MLKIFDILYNCIPFVPRMNSQLIYYSSFVLNLLTFVICGVVKFDIRECGLADGVG